MTGQQPARPACFETVLLPTDGSEFSRAAERIGIELCRHSGAKLIVMRMVLKGAGFGYLAAEPAAQQEAAAAKHLAELKREAEAAGVSCSAALRTADDPYKGIVQEAKDAKADVIVMGRKGRRGLARLMLGDATAKVIGYAHCSVMVVPEGVAMWDTIVLATDGSPYAEAAAGTAAAIAKCGAFPMAVLSVRVPTHSQERQAEAQPIVDRTLAELGERGLQATGIVEEGLTDEIVIKTARNAGNALIVLGSHGRTGFGRVLFGSKTERVINYANGAVLVAKAAQS